MFQLFITTRIADTETTQKRDFLIREDALDEAKYWINLEDQRRRKTPYEAPAYTLRLECEDGTILHHTTLAVEARKRS